MMVFTGGATERVIQESGIHVAHVRGDRAFYNLQSDTVTLPEREQFATANGYYQTALHELGHATRKLPRQVDTAKRDCPAVVGLGRNVRGGTRPRLSWGRSWL